MHLAWAVNIRISIIIIITAIFIVSTFVVILVVFTVLNFQMFCCFDTIITDLFFG